jgi:hypothetical protein
VALELGLRGAVYHRGRRAGARETTAHLKTGITSCVRSRRLRVSTSRGCARRGAEGHLLREDVVVGEVRHTLGPADERDRRRAGAHTVASRPGRSAGGSEKG